MRSSFVPVLIKVTWAASTHAPDVSVIVPTMEPRNVWLIAAAGIRIAIVQAANLPVHAPLKNKIMLVQRRGRI